MRLHEPRTDAEEVFMAQKIYAEIQAEREREAAKEASKQGRYSLLPGRSKPRAQSQTVRANFHATDVFERKNEADKPRQAQVFSPIADDGDSEKDGSRKTGNDDASQNGADQKTGKGLGKKLGSLLGRGKNQR